MTSHVLDMHTLVTDEPLGVINAQELAQARRDPEVIALLRDAERVLAQRTAGPERDLEQR